METQENNRDKETTIMDVQSTSSDTPISSVDATSEINQDMRLLLQNASSRPHPTGLLLRGLSVSVLAQLCKDELDKLERGEPGHEQYSVELFHRALAQHDALARETVQRCFKETVHHWMYSHPNREAACRLESEEHYVAQAFERFWQATASNQGMEFIRLSAALQSLRASLNGAILDTLRAYSRPGEVSLPEPEEPGKPVGEDSANSSEAWNILEMMLSNQREQRLAYLLYHCGLKPREIVRFCPQEWPDVQEIYRLRRTILQGLLRNTDQLRWRFKLQEQV
jgi:hypothetical protein